jgi:hypothetical protein
MAHADRLALIAQAVAKHQPEHRGFIAACTDCGAEVWIRQCNHKYCRRCRSIREADYFADWVLTAAELRSQEEYERPLYRPAGMRPAWLRSTH